MIWLLVLINITAPDVIYAGQLYEVHASITTNESLNGTLYTYVYRGLNCVSTGWWHGSDVALKPGTSEFVLKDSVAVDAPEGVYKLKVKLVAGNQTWQAVREVEVRHSKFPYLALLPLMICVLVILRWLL